MDKKPSAKSVASKKMEAASNLNSNDTNRLNEKFIQAFQAMLGDRATMFQFIDIFPYPIQIFDPDGFLLFANRAICEDSNVANLNEAIGIYNILQDPVTLDVLGLREPIEAVFKGERRTVHDVRIPYEDISAKFTQKDEQFHKVKYQDITGFQLWNEQDEIAFIIMIFITKLTYMGRSDVAKAQEYMRLHWLDNFDLEKIARAVSLSRRHFQRIFKEVANKTPLEYYQEIKIEKLQEKMLDPLLSITDAFSACGVESNGTWFNAFKKATGMTPTEYRRQKLNI